MEAPGGQPARGGPRPAATGRRGHWTVIAAVALATTLATGCAKQNVIDPSAMPLEFLAAAPDDPKRIDLSKLAVPTTASDQLGRGDVIDVCVETGYGQSADKSNVVPVRIADDGSATVPLVGRVNLAGLLPDQAEQAIATAAVERGIYRNPSVTVVMKKQRTNRVTVVGAVDKPGTFDLPRGNSDLLAALVAAGGLSEEAGANLEIRRAGAVPGVREDRLTSAPHELASYRPGSGNEPDAAAGPGASERINLVAATREGAAGVYLGDGDVVMVERHVRQPVHVLGLVTKAGEVELPPSKDLYLLDVLAMAGGTSTPWANRVHVIRRPPDRTAPVVVEVSLREAKHTGVGNLRMSPGDVVTVEQTPTTVLMDLLKNAAHFTFGSNVPIF